MKTNAAMSDGGAGFPSSRAGKANRSKRVDYGRLTRDLSRDRWLYMMLVPGVLYFLLFKYWPMYGLIIAFQDYQPFLGILHSKWVGLHQFERFFTDPVFWQLLRNTSVLAIYNIVFFFPAPIIIALLLNEVTKERFKRFVQTMVYLPHFISWPVVIGICFVVLSTTNGIVNEAITALGGKPISFLTRPDLFRTIVTLQVIWKETGWGTIIFLAALTSVDPQQYEAARLDGANRWQQLWYVTLPAIRTTIVLMFILRIGSFMDSGFEQIFLMLGSGDNGSSTREVGEVFDTFVYSTGLAGGQFSYSTAIGLFKSLISFVLVVGVNQLAKKFGEEGVY